MHRIRRKTLESLLPLLLLAAPLGMVYFGVGPLLPSLDASLGPHVPLVSVPKGTTRDVWSSVPGLFHVLLAAFQAVLLVELARLFWAATGALTTGRLMLTLLYEGTLVLDMFRLWGRDWFVWGMHELRLGDLCEPTDPCYPVSGAMPWPSLLALGLLLILLPALVRNHEPVDRGFSV